MAKRLLIKQESLDFFFSFFFFNGHNTWLIFLKKSYNVKRYLMILMYMSLNCYYTGINHFYNSYLWKIEILSLMATCGILRQVFFINKHFILATPSELLKNICLFVFFPAVQDPERSVESERFSPLVSNPWLTKK